MRHLQKYKSVKILACLLLVVFLALSLGTPAYADLGECADGSTPGATTANNGTVPLCADGSAPCHNGISHSPTGIPYCTAAPTSTATAQESPKSPHQCGDGKHGDAYTPSIDLGCEGKGNPIMDMLFGIVQFLSDGVGIVVVASLIVAGVQYSASGGDPNAAQAAMRRIRSSLTALLIFIFAYAILNYVLPGAVLK